VAQAPGLDGLSLAGPEVGVLIMVLLVVGWGYGLAAAIVCRSVRARLAGRSARALAAGLTLAGLVGASSSYAYARVLDTVGLLHHCDPVAAAAVFC
jgi:hypothetical protein